VVKTLFEKYGGFAAYRKVVSSFYDDVLTSPSLKKHFVNTDMARLIDHQTKFVTFISGGPGHISDEQLSAAHRNLGITQQEFDEIVELFEDTLEDFDFEAEDITYLSSAIRKRAHLIVRG
jgi:hemoglobin